MGKVRVRVEVVVGGASGENVEVVVAEVEY